MNFLKQSQLDSMYKKSYYLLSVLVQLKQVFSEQVPTAGVAFDGKNIVLMINPEFYAALTDEQQISLLLHEALHIEYQHLFMDRVKYKEHVKLNIAQDLVINSHPEISHLKNAGIGVFAEQFGLPEHETTDFYYRNLPTQQENQQGGTGHEHKSLPPEADAKIQEIKSKAAKACETMRYRINPVQKPYDWRAALANYIASADDYERVRTYRRLNRRTENEQIPGYKKLRHRKVAVVVDTSGSMLSYLAELVGQVCEIASKGRAEIWVLSCDTEATKPELFSIKKGVQLTGGGGTAYQPGLDAAAKLSPDVIIYLGDMEHFDKLQRPKASVIWANIVNNSKPNANFGKFLVLK